MAVHPGKYMTEKIYCVKCRKKTGNHSLKEVKTKNNRRMLKGICEVCGTGVNKFLPAKS
jgi:hypothetical protein